MSYIYSFFLAAILLLTPAFAAAKSVSVTIPHQPNSTSPLVDVYIEGRGPYKFLLDTGAGMSSITYRLSRQLGLKEKQDKSHQVLTVNGYADVRYTQMLNLAVTQKKVPTRSRLFITPPNPSHTHDGILGLNDLRGSKIVNDPARRQLRLTLPSKIPSCDALDRFRRCGIHPRNMPTVEARLGSKPAILLFDTGYTGSAPIIMFKSDYTNEIWNKNAAATQTITAFSNRPLKRILSNDFSFAGNSRCYADMYIRDPRDSSDKFREVAGLLGWWTVKNVAFTLDLKKMKLDYPSQSCPFTSVNTLGIGGFGSNGNENTIFIGNLTPNGPAYRAGLRNDMEIDRIHLASGQIVDTFKRGLRANSKLHVHSPPGSVVGFDVISNGRTRRVNVTAESPRFVRLN